MSKKIVDIKQLLDSHGDTEPSPDDTAPIIFPDDAFAQQGGNPAPVAEIQPTPSVELHPSPTVKQQKAVVKTLVRHIDDGSTGVFIPVADQDSSIVADPVILTPGNTHSVSEAQSPEIVPPDITLTVEGVAHIQGFNDEQQVYKDHLIKYATLLGLNVNSWKTQNDPAAPAPRRTWSTRKVALDEAQRIVRDAQIISRDIFTEKLFRPNTGLPWPDSARKAAILKTNMVVHRLCARGTVVKRYDDHGDMLLLEPQHPMAQRLPTAPGGQTIIDREQGDRAAITHAMCAVGAVVLSASPSTGRRLVEDVYKAMWSHGNACRQRPLDSDDIGLTAAMIDAGELVLNAFGLSGISLARTLYGVMYFHVGELK